MNSEAQSEKRVYSDGDIEDRIIDFLKQNETKDIINTFDDGCVFHNFIDIRHNILNWYPFSPNSNVLEVGAGMGAITGILSNRCEKVVALEHSKKRAEIIRQRFAGKEKNIVVVSQDIFDFDTKEKFDYITLIGVLEYMGIVCDEKNPYEKLLVKLRSFLKPQGKLLIAIENKYGLKYWCGASEDHTGIPFDGINSYKNNGITSRYQAGGVKTFSRKMLEDMLLASGFQHSRFYYPLPDYKFPSAIFSDDYLPSENDIQAIKFMYPGESCLVGDERVIYPEIIKNNSFPFFANSFLVETGDFLVDEHVIYASLKRDYKKEYKVITAINSEKEIIKRASCKESEGHLMDSFVYLEELKKHGIRTIDYAKQGDDYYLQYCDLKQASAVFSSELINNKRKSAVQMIDLLRSNLLMSSDLTNELNAKIQSMSDLDEPFGFILEKGYIDMTFINSFFDKDELIFFDQEWCFENIPLNYILYRAVTYAYPSGKTDIPIEELYCYIGIDKELQSIYDRFETIMLNEMMDKAVCDVLDPMMYRDDLEVIVDAREKIGNLSGHVELLLESERQLQQKVRESQQKECDLQQKVLELLQTERDLNNELKVIRDSRAFKIMSNIWKINGAIFPIGSKRRKFVGRTIHVLKHPITLFGKTEIQQSEKSKETSIKSVTDISMCEEIVFESCDKPDVSIIIPVYNQFSFTYQCLQSIKANSGRVKYEVILADDCSTDLTRDILQVVKNLRVIQTTENLRFLRNCNNAAKHANGKYILFLNNDTQVQENWLQPLVDLCEEHSDIGMVGSKLIYPNGALQEAGGILWRDGSAWNYGNGQDASKPEFNYVKDVDYISGASIMIRSDLWKEIGGFDERFAPAYCEDSDLAFEVRKHGYRVVYQPLSVVVHFEGVSNGTDLASGVKKYQVENSQKLKEKWKEEFVKQYSNAENVFCARDRSSGKKTVLIIDHYVPEFDKDAGSRTIWQYINMFIDKGYNVKFMGDNFYQSEPYTTALQQIGVEVLYGSWYAKNYKKWIINNKENINFAFLNRPHITAKYIDFIKKETDIKCIYYGCDLHCLRIKREYELSGDKKLLNEAKEWKNKEFDIMRKADVSYYPSFVEVEEIHKVDSSIVAKTFDVYVYEKFRENIPMDFENRNGLLFVGGFGHPPNVDAVVWFIEKVYPIIREKEPDIPFYVVGSNPPDEINKLDGNGIIIKGFVSDEELETLYDTCRMVVVPLRFGAGVKGKVIEALYYGTPMITTSIGIEGIIGADSFVEIADDKNSFAEKVLSLYFDKERWVETVKVYQSYAKKHFRVEAVWKNVEMDFQ